MRQSRRAVLLQSGDKPTAKIVITGLLSTDTISAVMGGNTYTPVWDSVVSEWVFDLLPLGTYTITATRGGDTITKSVLVDAPTEYSVYMAFSFTITLTGTGNSNYCRITYNGNNYYGAGSLVVPNGGSIACFCNIRRSGGTSVISINGVTKASGTPYEDVNWTFVPQSDATLEFQYLYQSNGYANILITGGE